MLFLRKKYLSQIKKNISNKNSLILVGPRQVGKSSLIKILIQEEIVKNFCLLNGDDLQFENFKSPKEFLDFLDFKYDILNKNFLIIDEAQKVNNIGIFIKYLVDKNKNGEIKLKIIISGSGSLKIFQGITDSLIGRYDLINVRPFDFEEFLEFSGVNLRKIDFKNLENVPEFFLNDVQKHFEIYKKYGGYPDVVLAKTDEDKKSKLKNIYEDYLYKDIAFLLKNEEFIGFEKFLKITASKIGSLISIQNLADEMGVKRILAEKYLDILKSSFLFSSVQPFSGGKILNEIKKANKFYIVDLGMLNFLLGIGEFSGDFKGKIVENFVFNELFVNKKDFQDVYFWQNRNGSEIDFLLIDKFDKKIQMIEVKSGKKDIIPKVFFGFLEKYGSFIEKIFTTSDGFFSKKLNGGKIFNFIDYRFIGIMFNLLKK